MWCSEINYDTGRLKMKWGIIMKSTFFEAHHQAQPLILHNCWDAMSAQVISERGAQAVATSSYAIANAWGYEDGEQLPFEQLVWMAKRLVASVNVPVSVDVEGLYAESLDKLEAHATQVIATGVAGINFEDRHPEKGLYTVSEQAKRLEIVSAVAKKAKLPVFINARTDVFLEAGKETKELVATALERALIYADNGADGIFIPGLTDLTLLAEFVKKAPVPVNRMITNNSVSLAEYQAIGVSRISYGPSIYLSQKEAFADSINEWGKM